MQNISKNRIWTANWFIICCFYSVAYGLMLLNPSVFWDDYATTGFYANFTSLLNISTALGTFLNWGVYLNKLLFSFGNSIGVFLARLVTFVAYLLSALLLEAALRKIKEIKPIERFFIVLFFAILPVNAARMSLCTMGYALGYLVFFCGLRLTAAFCNTGALLARLGALALFFISFTTNSLLVFYLVPILYLARVKWEIVKSRPYTMVLKHADFLLLPVVFWLIKGNFYTASGLGQAGYNTITLAGLISAPLFSMSVVGSVLELMGRVVVSSGFLSVLAALLMAAVYSKYCAGGADSLDADARSAWLMVVGFGVLMAGIFPYAAVFKLPGPGWDSRDGLLLPLGAAFVLVYGVKELFRVLHIGYSSVRVCFIYFLAAIAFTVADTGTYFRFMQQNYKQQSLIANFKESEIVRDNTTFIFQDEARDYDGVHDIYAPYEYSGLFMLAFGDQKRIGYWDGEYENWYKLYFNPGGIFDTQAENFKVRDYIPRPPQYKIIISKGRYPLDQISLLRLTLRRFIQPERVRQDIKDVLRLDYVALPDK